ncbi:unnamed protein product [Alopecurus aequalis]
MWGGVPSSARHPSIPTCLPSPWPEPSPPHTTRSPSRSFPSPPLRLDLLFPYPPAAALLDSPPPAGRPWCVLGLACAMDDAGEVRLLRKKPKTKRPPAAAPPPADGGRGRDRFQALWQDYHDLLQETEAKKRRLDSLNRRKLGLLAQVKFLRKKYSSFVKDDSQRTHHSLKKKNAWQIPSTLGMNEGPSTSKNTYLDLNQDYAM